MWMEVEVCILHEQAVGLKRRLFHHSQPVKKTTLIHNQTLKLKRPLSHHDTPCEAC